MPFFIEGWLKIITVYKIMDIGILKPLDLEPGTDHFKVIYVRIKQKKGVTQINVTPVRYNSFEMKRFDA